MSTTTITQVNMKILQSYKPLLYNDLFKVVMNICTGTEQIQITVTHKRFIYKQQEEDKLSSLLLIAQ